MDHCKWRELKREKHEWSALKKLINIKILRLSWFSNVFFLSWWAPWWILHSYFSVAKHGQGYNGHWEVKLYSLNARIVRTSSPWCHLYYSPCNMLHGLCLYWASTLQMMGQRWGGCRNRCRVELIKSELQIKCNFALSCSKFITYA